MSPTVWRGWIDERFDGDDPYPSLELIDRNTALVRYEPDGPQYVVDVDDALEELERLGLDET